ncbi:MAG TPA: BON domain-containing protein [Terracidiphilus sp.]|nr:BON domain-containing protein [Terracidiphilus sp.]
MRKTESIRIVRNVRNVRAGFAALAVLALAATLAAGCKHAAPTQTDQQLTTSVQSKIQGESALNGQNIQVSVSNGVATLSGNANDDASRALAGNDAGSVPGVRTVVNNLMVQPAQQVQAAAPAQQAAAAAPASAPERTRERHDRNRSRGNTQTASGTGTGYNGANLPPAGQSGQPAQPMQQQAQAAPQQPPPPPQPVVRQVAIPTGTSIPIRLVDAISTKTAQPNDVFHASVAQDVVINGLVAIPRGAPVLGRVVDVHEAAHFKGAAMLSLQLTQISAQGQRIDVTTDTFMREGKARGKNTAEKAGGGAVLGAIVGALAGGGKGAAIGALAGGGAGAGINAVTRGEQIELPSETPLEFHLQNPADVTLTILPNGKVATTPNQSPQLLRR